MSGNVSLLRPELLWLALVVVPLLALGVLRLAALSRWRRWSALLLQTVSALLLVVALAQPAIVKANNDLSMVVVLDTSASRSDAARQQEATFASNLMRSATPAEHLYFVAAAGQATILKPEEVTTAITGTLGAPNSSAASSILDLRPDATDLEGGLRLAGSLLGDGGMRRVVLVTDGWETVGNVANEAARLTSRGVALDVVPLTALGDPEVIARGLSSPQYARVGDSIQSDLDVYSTRAVSATLHISVDGGAPTNRVVALQAGDNRVPIDQKVQREGFHTVQVDVASPADSRSENNRLTSTVVVKPQPKVLVLEDRPGEAAQLAQALSSRQITADVRGPSSIPTSADELSGYDAIVLNNVAATSFTLDQQRTLQEYVRRNGHGLVTVGGPTSYALGGYLDSVLEEALPVSSRPAPRPEQGKTALILVMDRSASMDEYQGQDLGPSKFDMAKAAARLAIDALRDGDTLGVLTFDSDNLWVYPPSVIHSDADKERVKNMVTNIELGGGTSIYPAVSAAADAIKSADAPSKHLVLLTDGREYETPDYDSLLAQIRANGITLSTIGIGSDADKELLTRLAKLGQGRYYFTDVPENVPKIVFKELDLALKESKIEGAVQPHIAAASPLLRGFRPQDVPQLSGYDVTVAKPDAVVGLVSDQGHPLLAHWNYGLGRVVSFTSDAGPHWASRWLSWSSFADFWSQAVRWTMASPVNRQLQPSIVVSRQSSVASGSTDNGLAHLVVESLNPDNSFADLADVTAAIRSPSGVVTSTLMVQTAPGRYEADIPLGEAGAYEARFARAGEGGLSITESAGFSVPTSPELLNAGTNDRLLKRLLGGRDYLKDARGAFSREGLTPAPGETQSLWPYFVAPALILLLLSVAVRRLAFRFTRRDQGKEL